jgi:hypothetical protein
MLKEFEAVIKLEMYINKKKLLKNKIEKFTENYYYIKINKKNKIEYYSISYKTHEIISWTEYFL